MRSSRTTKLGIRHSKYIFPLQIFLDLLLVGAAWYFSLIYFSLTPEKISIVTTLLAWLLSLYFSKNYRIRRFSRIPKTLQNSLLQTFLFLALNISSHQLFLNNNIDNDFYIFYHIIVTLLILVLRIIELQSIKKYRSLGGNYRRTLILGDTPDTRNLEKNINDSKQYGYKLMSLISNQEFSITTFKQDCIKLQIDEIFIAESQFTSNKLNKIIDYAESKLVKVRLVPDFSELHSNNLRVDYIGFQPVYIYRELPFDDFINASVKRLFDIIFSLFIIIFILSWLTPLIAFLIRLESKGDIFFKQQRTGLNNDNFYCYKFRSMKNSDDAHKKQAIKGDDRITKIGAFMRKTSIDEFPQFFNVLIGNMSVVGPRPHMIRHTEEFSQSVDRYMVRHFVKPGITGLAQVSGYRGETKDDWEIKGRVKMDIFYIENWNLFLDLKIIFYTFFNAIKGDKKAY